VTVYWTFPAEEDLATLLMRQPERADRAAVLAVAAALAAAAESLARFPSRNEPGRVAGTRELIVGHHILVHEVAEGDVHVLRCLGARRSRSHRR